MEDKKESNENLPAVSSSSDVAVTKNGGIVAASPAAMLQLALDKNLDLDRVEKMIDLQAKWDKMEAEKAYTKSMARLKKKPPKILKDKNVCYTHAKGTTDYNHATLGNVEESVTPWLASGGFSVSFKPSQNSENDKIRITGIITHEKGHKESAWLEYSPETSGGKNGIQGLGSTQTYLERYILLGLCGLATHDQDDDGKGAGSGMVYITEKQISTIRDLLISTKSDEAKFIKWLNVDSIDNIPEGEYKRVIANLESKEGGK